MTAETFAPSLASRTFDLAVLVAGFAFAAAVVIVDGELAAPWHYLLAIPLIVLIAQFPLALDRRGGAIEIGFDSCVLIFLACSGVHTGFAVLAWTAGVVLTQVTNDKRRSTKVFNIGLSVLSGAVALSVIAALSAGDRAIPSLAAVGAGAVAYFLCDFVLSAISVALDQRLAMLPQLVQPDAIDAAACFLATASLGYLAALVLRHFDEPAIVILLAVPLAILLVAARAVTRGRENARRLAVLFAAAARAQTLRNVAEVLQSLQDDAKELLRVRSVSLRDEPPARNELGARFADGYQERWIVAPAGHRARSSIGGDKQALEALVAVATEAFSRLRLTAEMTHMAHHDVLTGLPNRALFLDRAEHALLMAHRRGTRLAVLYCDLDGFKRVNDRFGHAAGDALLVDVGGRLQQVLRDSDTVARLGGDEFAILLEDIEGDQHVEMVCDRILSVLRSRIPLADHLVSVTTSVGVAFSETANSADHLLRNADMAMYEAKRRGKDRCSTYEAALGDARVQRLELVESLRSAVDDGNVGVVYQPIVQLRTGKVIGVETLARWSLDGTPIAPDVFIGAAEESGLVVTLGQAVLDAVTVDAPTIAAAAGRRLTLGLNISSQQIRSPEFVTQVEAAQASMDDVELMLEISERDFVINDSGGLETMSRLASRGVRFAVDDFGVGLSSIGFLQQLPIHVLKTDRSFTAAIDTDERACKLLRSVVVMGEALDLQVVVGGVERQEQVEHLVRHVDAQLAQGYLLQGPVKLAALLDILAAQREPAAEPVAALASRLV